MKRYSVNDEDIISDFQAGVSLRQLAVKYGMSVRAIQYRLDRNGIERRDSSLTKITICEVCEKVYETNQDTYICPECLEKSKK